MPTNWLCIANFANLIDSHVMVYSKRRAATSEEFASGLTMSEGCCLRKRRPTIQPFLEAINGSTWFEWLCANTQPRCLSWQKARPLHSVIETE